VYQTNIYTKAKQFHSFRKVKESLEAPANECELFSFQSISKGISGECGFRGGYVEISSMNDDVLFEINKAKSNVNQYPQPLFSARTRLDKF
jgi:alanine transaminase